MGEKLVMPVVLPYNLKGAKEVAKLLVNAIGKENLYTDHNEFHNEAPYNWLLVKQEEVGRLLKNLMHESHQIKKIVITMNEYVEGDLVWGIFVRKGDECRIMIKAKNTCWGRFVTLKELASLFISYYEGLKKDLSDEQTYVSCLESLENAFNPKARILDNPQTACLFDGEMESESFATALAIEMTILLPERQLTVDLIKEYKESKRDLLSVAESLMMPKDVLQLYVDNGMI
jgi:hypothetical protein